MLRVRVHAVSCQWTRDAAIEGAEAVLLRLTGTAQAPKTYFLGRFPKSSSRRLTRISHVASGPITLGLATSATGPMIGVYTLQTPDKPAGRYERHLVNFVSRGSSLFTPIFDRAHFIYFHFLQKRVQSIGFLLASAGLHGPTHLHCCGFLWRRLRARLTGGRSLILGCVRTINRRLRRGRCRSERSLRGARAP